MGQPLTGALVRAYQNTVPYDDARVWGTGINPIHAVRDGEPRNDGSFDAKETPASAAMRNDPGFIQYGAPWGYNPEDIDINGIGVFNEGFTQDDWPSMDETTTQTRADIGPQQSRPWGSSGAYNNALRNQFGGAYSGDAPPRKGSNQLPDETVSEGWLNKPASGMHEGIVADAKPSADQQIFVQTSMVQRYKDQDNQRAQERATDDARTPIRSRIAPMKIKAYSGEDRHYDMFPRQIDQIIRPFKYRTAGTGPQGYLKDNYQYDIDAIQRTPPPEPSSGIPDTQFSDEGEYGYNQEDVGYY